MGKGTMLFQGDKGAPEAHLAKSVVNNVTDDAALLALQTALAALTDCNAAGRSFSAQTIIDAAKPGADVNVDRKLTVWLRDTATGNRTPVTIPAPVSTAVELTDQGERATSACVASVVSAVNTATGKTYVGLYGKVTQKG